MEKHPNDDTQPQYSSTHRSSPVIMRRTIADGISRTDDGVPVRQRNGQPNEYNDNNNDPDYQLAEYRKDDSSSASNNNNRGLDPNRPMMRQSHPGEHRGDHGEKFPLRTSALIFAGCAAVNSCGLGYDMGVNMGAGKRLQSAMDLSDVQLEVFLGSLNLFAMLGSLGSHLASDRLGRRGAFMVASVGFVVGITFMITASGFVQLMFGRVFVGLGVGFGLALDPMYIAEISPAAYRGRLVTWSEVATNIGILLGFVSNLMFYGASDNAAWRGTFGLGMILPVIMVALACFVMPESPRWLLTKNREEEATGVLSKVYPLNFDIGTVVNDIKENIRKDTAAEKAVGWDVILFPSPAFKRMLIVGVGTAIAQQAVGIDAIQYFLVFVLDRSGIEDERWKVSALIFLGLIKLGFIIIAMRLFDKKGRRPLLFISCAGMAFSLMLLSLNFYVNRPSPGFAMFGISLYMAFFSFGIGPGAWLVPSEVFATTIRSKAMSVATFLNRVTATIMTSTFFSTANAMSYAGFFVMMAIICLFVLLFFYIYLPETKGRSLEGMSLFYAEITGDRSILDIEFKEKDQASDDNDDNQGDGVGGVADNAVGYVDDNPDIIDSYSINRRRVVVDQPKRDGTIVGTMA
mmetsp:Transcript_34130/g.50150  ORF Transcript_34130/g.50150 Transcript_34130/m.50150 type:complete len:630 (+) Transcript_34130:166-2055(+)|eukprot:CAMPEP_0195541804 /NCGR_PEP_ID=MMETSP0794_2-20130614/51274_1 /TAXON_ID=515487 /ORGANISM="Stephanopyxis turris, Strain CCMP 815" /LENGTH=629 /DNA_ID=CAMNT_0040675913 /DNA_START=163 /DNA_END=2052 /DNA_ORIENTATION=-